MPPSIRARWNCSPALPSHLKCLQDAGYLLSIVSNQQGIGLGYFGYRDFIDGNRKLLRLLGKEGIAIRKIYFCPHSLGEPCDCRKPAPGLILKALRDLNATPETTFVIGDSAEDMEAARAAGCSGLYVGPPAPALYGDYFLRGGQDHFEGFPVPMKSESPGLGGCP